MWKGKIHVVLAVDQLQLTWQLYHWGPKPMDPYSALLTIIPLLASSPPLDSPLDLASFPSHLAKIQSGNLTHLPPLSLTTLIIILFSGIYVYCYSHTHNLILIGPLPEQSQMLFTLWMQLWGLILETLRQHNLHLTSSHKLATNTFSIKMD